MPEGEICWQGGGSPCRDRSSAEEGDDIDWQVRLGRRVRRRHRWLRGCKCLAWLAIVTASPRPRLIPKGGLRHAAPGRAVHPGAAAAQDRAAAESALLEGGPRQQLDKESRPPEAKQRVRGTVEANWRPSRAEAT